MQNDLISRSVLLENFNSTGTNIVFDLPVEEVLGEDVDLDDFSMLVQDVIMAYRKMVIAMIEEQPTAYNVREVVQQLEDFLEIDRGLSKRLVSAVKDIVQNGGKE